MATRTLNEAAAELGRRGGQRKVPKGFALMTDDEKRRIQSMGGKARWGNKAGKGKRKGKKA
jgi:hypothetical protein